MEPTTQHIPPTPEPATRSEARMFSVISALATAIGVLVIMGIARITTNEPRIGFLEPENILIVALASFVPSCLLIWWPYAAWVGSSVKRPNTSDTASRSLSGRRRIAQICSQALCFPKVV